MKSFCDAVKEWQANPMIVIYDNPRDIPGKFVARLWKYGRATMDCVVKDTLEEIRQEIPPGFYRMGRQHMDDPVIVEVWF